MFKAEADIEIGRFTAKLGEMEARARQTGSRIASGTTGMGERFGGRMLGGFNAGKLVKGLGAATLLYQGAKVAMESLNVAMERESLVAGLSASSTEEVSEQLMRLRELAKLPGLGFDQAVEGSTRLQAVGLSAAQSEGMLEQFGNALALVGKGKADLDGVILALTQIAAKGKISAQEINQIAERVPQIRGLIESAFGTADTEALAKQGVTATEFFDKVTAAAAKLPRAIATVQERQGNLNDEWRETQAILGSLKLETYGHGLDFLSSKLGDLNDVLRQLNEQEPPAWMLLDGSAKSDFPELFEQPKFVSGLRPGGADVMFREPETDEEKKQREAREQKASDLAGLKTDMARDRIDRLEGPEKVTAAKAELARVLAETVGKFPFFDQTVAGLEQLAAKRVERGDLAGAKEAFGWLKDAEKLNGLIQKSATETQDALARLREEAAEGAFRLLTPQEQAKELRARIEKSFGIDIAGAAEVQRGLEDLRSQVQDARNRGDVEAERAALEKLKAAQEDVASLSGLDRAGGAGGRAGLGEAGRTFNLLFGRPANDAGLSEAKTQTGIFRSVEKLLKSIDGKLPLDGDVFTDF